MSFDTAFSLTVDVEGDGGGKANIDDAGGATRWGITEATARAHGYTGLMSKLPLDVAKSIYRTIWDGNSLDSVDALSVPIAQFIFDTSVLGGPAVFWLQRSLNVLNQNQADYFDVPVTGHLAAQTSGALSLYLHKRGKLGEIVLLRMLNSFRGVYLIEDAEKRSADERFEFGWISNRIHMA
jgi:lysozyme family protein